MIDQRSFDCVEVCRWDHQLRSWEWALLKLFFAIVICSVYIQRVDTCDEVGIASRT